MGWRNGIRVAVPNCTLVVTAPTAASTTNASTKVLSGSSVRCGWYAKWSRTHTESNPIASQSVASRSRPDPLTPAPKWGKTIPILIILTFRSRQLQSSGTITWPVPTICSHNAISYYYNGIMSPHITPSAASSFIRETDRHPPGLYSKYKDGSIAPDDVRIKGRRSPEYDLGLVMPVPRTHLCNAEECV